MQIVNLNTADLRPRLTRIALLRGCSHENALLSELAQRMNSFLRLTKGNSKSTWAYESNTPSLLMAQA